MAIKSESLGLCSWNFWNFLCSMGLSNSEYLILKFLTWHGIDEFGWNDPKVNKKGINYIGEFTIPSNIYDGTFLWNYPLAELICKLIKWLNE